MHPSVKKALAIATAIMAAFILVMIIAAISVYRESQKIEERVQSKIDRVALDRATVQQPIKIVRYDSLTQAKLDTIEVRRSLSHRHVDNLYDGELQSVLDSMYNGR